MRSWGVCSRGWWGAGRCRRFQGFGSKGNAGARLPDTQIASGVKDALSVGTQKAVTLVAKPGGYLENSAIKILLPKNLQIVEKGLRGGGAGAEDR